MEKVAVTIGGLTVIAFIYWFFFGKKEDAVEASDKLTITVDGGYKPSVIRVKQGRKTTLTFIRKDPNTCLEDFILPEFKVKKYLPINTPVSVTITPPSKGTFDFHCGMNMFHGKIEVI